MNYSEKQGDLIAAALNGEFDLIAHGCNCQSVQRRGIAKEMVKHFGTDKFPMETVTWLSNPVLKLGNIDFQQVNRLIVVNCYTQLSYGTDRVHADYEAITLCFRKINETFNSNLRIGLPKIGCGLAGGDWNIVSRIIQSELKDMKSVTVMYL